VPCWDLKLSRAADIMQRHPTLASNPMDGSNATAVRALSSTTYVPTVSRGWDGALDAGRSSSYVSAMSR
jgi:hypothetical protein